MGDELRYPVWTLFDTNLASLPFPQGIAPITKVDVGQMAMLIFSSPALAAKFIQDICQPKLAPLALQFPQQVIDALDYCEQKGAMYVAINGVGYQLRQFRGVLRTNIQNGPPSAN